MHFMDGHVEFGDHGFFAYERRRALRREKRKLCILPVCGVKAHIFGMRKHKKAIS